MSIEVWKIEVFLLRLLSIRKSMRRFTLILTTSFLFMMLASSVVFNACTKDPCKDIICKNNGVCRDGGCKCSQGFEGPFCATKMYEKFIGTWDGFLRCNGLIPEVINLVIAPEPLPNRVTLYDIFDQNVALKATVNVDKIQLDDQSINGMRYTGHGYLDGKYITLYIETRNETTLEMHSCVYNGTKFTQP